MITHPNLLAIKAFESIESLQAFAKEKLQKSVFFYPIKPCHYKVFEAGKRGQTQPLYVISQKDQRGDRCFVLYRIVDTNHLTFSFDRKDRT